jgi:uroporphyrinogen-III decarboxylase
MSRRPEITWTIETPIGRIRRKRLWQEESYSWNVSEWGISTAQDLRVLADALSRIEFKPAFERHHQWSAALGDLGLLYMSIGYSAMGQLLNYWMGIEKTMFAAADMPEVLEDVVEAINTRLLDCVDLLCTGPAEVIILGDNFSSDVQSPRFCRTWSARFYREAFRRIQAAGKFSAVHVDGRLKGLLREFGGIGCNCIDAVTPAPMGDLTPQQCREEAGPDLILSGGVPPSVWSETASDDDFRRAVGEWLEIRKLSPRLIAAAGDQVPPKTPEHRIEMMRDLVERTGRY